MKYRALDANGDHQFGRAGLFLVDSPQAVAQAVLTRLRLWTGEWFLDNEEGTDYANRILGYGTQGTRDVEIKERILNTPGVRSILAYQSAMNGRVFNVTTVIDTAFGTVTVSF